MAYRTEWMMEVEEELQRSEIRYEIADHRYYIFYCYRNRDGARYTYYAGSGKILGIDGRGLELLIRLCKDSGKGLIRHEEDHNPVDRVLVFPWHRREAVTG